MKMRSGLLRNKRTAQVIADKAAVASSLLARTKGLLGRRSLPPGEALVILKCNFVHTFFMLFPIDLIFCSKDHKTLALQENLKPWRFSKFVSKANYVIELPCGTLAKYQLQNGDELELADR